MPAAAVIPAPIAYIKVVAVKKLVVGSRARAGGSPRGDHWQSRGPVGRFGWRCSSPGAAGGRNVYFEKIRVLRAGAGAWIVAHGIME